ncbi:hypothetical protein BZA77DRAFT_298431 [Pyronema omphalodes]|nr:hypothetical protein BZA77DRAFT_298431 [Pyronema omphalodes]
MSIQGFRLAVLSNHRICQAYIQHRCSHIPFLDYSCLTVVVNKNQSYASTEESSNTICKFAKTLTASSLLVDPARHLFHDRVSQLHLHLEQVLGPPRFQCESSCSRIQHIDVLRSLFTFSLSIMVRPFSTALTSVYGSVNKKSRPQNFDKIPLLAVHTVSEPYVLDGFHIHKSPGTVKATLMQDISSNISDPKDGASVKGMCNIRGSRLSSEDSEPDCRRTPRGAR